MMKGWSGDVIVVTLLSLLFGLIFKWLYPLTEISTPLIGLFVFVAFIFVKLGGWLYNFVKIHSATSKKQKGH